MARGPARAHRSGRRCPHPTCKGSVSESGSRVSNRGPKEQRVYGIFEAVECLKDGVVRLVRTANGVTRASATSLAT